MEAYDGPFNGSTTPMFDLGMYIFKYLNTGKITPEESFTNAYVEEVYDSEHVGTAIKRLHVILDSKCEKENLHKVTKNKCQHLTMTRRNEFIKLLHKFEELFDAALGTWKRYPVDFELK